MSLVAVCALLFWGCAGLQDQNEVGAKAAATVFLSALDSGDAARAYELFSNNAKTFTTKEQVAKWIQIRRLYGAMLSRQLTDARTTNHVPLGPDGTYEILRFHTTYSSKKDGLDVVAVAKHPEGWRVFLYRYR